MEECRDVMLYIIFILVTNSLVLILLILIVYLICAFDVIVQKYQYLFVNFKRFVSLNQNDEMVNDLA